MKTMKLLTFLLLALPAVVQAQLTFTINNGAITITGYIGNPTVLIIPNTTNGYPVTTIAAFALQGNNTLTSLTIGTNVSNIGSAAFSLCGHLGSVTIPGSVTNTGNYAFGFCVSLTNIMVSSKNLGYSIVNGVLFNKNQTAMVIFPAGLAGDYAIPSTVINILTRAFEGATLSNVGVPGSVTQIGGLAFAYCNNLTTLTIPSSVTSISADATEGCANLTNITVSSQNPSYSSVNGVLFDKNQTMLEAFPAGLIGSYVIPGTVISIVVDAFAYSKLTNVAIPGSVTSISGNAFFDSTSLVLVTIPNSVTNIGSYAFGYCSGLTNLTIGSGVTSIGTYAFYNCTKLSGVFFQGNAPTPTNDPTVFTSAPATVYYLPGTTGWGATFDGRPTALWLPPTITIQPASQTNLAGSTVSFDVTAGGTGPFTYQWQFNGNNIAPFITTVAGNGNFFYPFSGDGGAATNASLLSPNGVAFDASGNLYIVDSADIRLRKVDTNGIITTVAGNGSQGYSGDGGAATNASLNNLTGVACDASDNLYISDIGNNRLRKVDTNGIITTVAGNGNIGYSGDGGAATNASLYYPFGMACDAFGNLYFADANNYRIRRVDTNGIITNVAGNGSGIVSNGQVGDGGAATNAILLSPDGVAFDASGNLYVADLDRIRKVDSNGIITTVAGNGNSGYSGDGNEATNASLYFPEGVACDASGNLYIADEINNRIREVHFAGFPTFTLTNVSITNVGNYSVVVTS